MTDHPPKLDYAAKVRPRVLPSGRELFTFLFFVLGVLAGLVGISGFLIVIILCIDPRFISEDEPAPAWMLGACALLYGGALWLSFIAIRIARRRLRSTD